MYDAALQLYNKLLGICLDEYEEFSDAEIKKRWTSNIILLI